MGFLGSLLKLGAAPIGVDLGNANLKLAQVNIQDGQPVLTAAASEPIPSEVRADPKGRIDFFLATVSKLLSRGGFRGRKVALGLPASFMHYHRLRLPQMDDAGIKQAIGFECADKLPFHPSRALIRHLVAGDIYEDNEPRHEVIVMAARRELTDRLLDAAGKAKLEIAGVNPEPIAIGACFGGPETASAAKAYIDIGSASTRVYVAAGRKIQFARAIPVGADHFDTAIAYALRTTTDEARKLRLGASMNEPAANGTAVDHARIEQAMNVPLRQLVEELELSLRYHRATFPSTQVDQLVLLGACSAHRRICQKISVELHLPAIAGDPLERLEVAEHLTAEASDDTPPPPAWAVAIGLSLGALDKAA